MSAISVPPVDFETLTNALTLCMKRVGESDLEDEALDTFLFRTLDEECAKVADTLDKLALMTRGMMLWRCVNDDSEALIHAGLAQNSGGHGVNIHSAFVHAACTAPLVVEFDEGKKRFQLQFESSKVLDLAIGLKDHDAGYDVLPMGKDGRGNPLAAKGLRTALKGLRSSRDDAEGESLGEMMAKTGDTSRPRYRPGEHAEYDQMLASRERLLGRITPEERAFYENTPLDGESLKQSYALENGMRSMAKQMGDLGRHLPNLVRVGPWDHYQHLDMSKGWDYPAYLRVVTRSPAHASIPCRVGLVPAFYIATRGSLADLREVLELCPSAVRARDAAGRTILLDLMEYPDRDEQASLMLTAGADPDDQTPAGHTPFGNAIRHMRFRVIVEMLDAGASPYLDIALDQGMFLAVAARPGCPSKLRYILQSLHDQWPKDRQSVFGE